MDYILLGSRIRQERININITQEALAEKANISPSFMGQIERGDRKLSLETLVSIAKVLGVSLDYLVYGKRKSNAEVEKLISLINDRTEQEICMLHDVAKAIYKYKK